MSKSVFLVTIETKDESKYRKVGELLSTLGEVKNIIKSTYIVKLDDNLPGFGAPEVRDTVADFFQDILIFVCSIDNAEIAWRTNQDENEWLNNCLI